MQFIKNFFKNEEGLTVVEYAVAAGMISLGVIVAFGLLGDQVFRIIDALTTLLVGAA